MGFVYQIVQQFSMLWIHHETVLRCQVSSINCVDPFFSDLPDEPSGKVEPPQRKCGFDKVFDTNLGADMTIMEEASEFLERVKKGGVFPMITTCCPALIKFMEKT